MTISNVFKEHLSGKLDKLQTNALYNETKRKELEDALKLISPSYTVCLRSSRSADRKDLDLSVGFDDDLTLPFHIQVVKHGDIHISDTDMELLLDYPNMQVGSPAFNTGLKNFLTKTIYQITTRWYLQGMTKEELQTFRTYLLEKIVQIDSNPQGLYEELRKAGKIKDQSVLSAVRESSYAETYDPIDYIDWVIGLTCDGRQQDAIVDDGDKLIFGDRLRSLASRTTDETIGEGDTIAFKRLGGSLIRRGIGERGQAWSFVSEGSVGNYSRGRPTSKGGSCARGPLRPSFPIDMDIAFMYGGMPGTLPREGVSVTVMEDDE